MKEEKLRTIPVPIENHLDGEGGWSVGGKHWDNKTLRIASESCKEFDIPLCCIDISGQPWGLTKFSWILYHIKRIENANLDYPIILDMDGQIVDGWHRIAKAMLSGVTIIKAKRLLIMPEPDRIDAA